MIVLASVLAVAASGFVPLATDPAEAFYVDESLDVDGKLLSWRFVDLDADEGRELVLGIRTPAGERELHVHRMLAGRIEREPHQTVPVLEDVLAWGVADVRSEPGRELVFLTRAGAWSYSLTLPGYKGNVAPLVREEMIYDTPDPRSLPYWAYVLPAHPRDLVLLPGRERFAIWGPKGESGDYAPLASFEVRDDDEEADARQRQARQGGGEVRVEVGGSSPFLREGARRNGSLHSARFAYSAPALVDLDGDGFLDLAVADGEQIAVHPGGPEGPSAEPSRIETLPAELLANEDDDEQVEVSLVDVDADGDLDVLGHVWEDVDGFENAKHRILIYRADEERLFGDEPDQVLRFEAGLLVVEVADVDDDGRADLALRKLELPSVVGVVTGLEFKFTYLVYLGERRGFARRPALKHDETFDEDSIVGLAANRELALDCDGDGIADLVEIDLEGRIAIRRLRKESSFFGGDSWELERAPWKLFDTGGSIESLTVEDLNGDGLGDVISGSEERLTVLLSSRGRNR